MASTPPSSQPPSISPVPKVPVITTNPAFSSPDADIILQSIDHVQFRAHRWPLVQSSEVFRDMFAFQSHNGDAPREIPIIPLAEKADVIELFLRFVYPQFRVPIPSNLRLTTDSEAAVADGVDGQPPVTMEQITRLLALADKYNVPRVSS